MSTSGTAASDPRAATAGRVGPNAITQLLVALRAACLDGVATDVLADAGAAEWIVAPPNAMVDEARVARVHQMLRAMVPREQAEPVLRAAGRLTADYLLAHRIPRPVQLLLKVMPARLAALVFTRAIRAHAWTFAGTGRFSARVGHTTIFRVDDNPFCRGERAEAPVCVWHASVFQRLFAALVSPKTQVEETLCAARGDACCSFALTWGARRVTPLSIDSPAHSPEIRFHADAVAPSLSVSCHATGERRWQARRGRGRGGSVSGGPATRQPAA